MHARMHKRHTHTHITQRKATQFGIKLHNSIHYVHDNTIQDMTSQDNTIQHNTDTMQQNTIQYVALSYDSIPHSAIYFNTYLPPYILACMQARMHTGHTYNDNVT